MNQFKRDEAEQGDRVALALFSENFIGGNRSAQTVAERAAYAEYKAERDRIYDTDYGLDD